MNKLYFGDNLEIPREMSDESIYLICTDPPFNSGRDYNTFLGDSLAQKKAFTDTWMYDTAAEAARVDIEQRAITNDTYKALDTCLKGYDLVLQNAISGNKGAMRAYLAFMGPVSPRCTAFSHRMAVYTCTAIRLLHTTLKA